MNLPLWSAVDDYWTTKLHDPDDALDTASAASAAEGLPPIAVTAPQGKFLHLLARATGARRILEVGTLGGYSTIWLARALPSDGELVTCEVDPHHAEVAAANVARAGWTRWSTCASAPPATPSRASRARSTSRSSTPTRPRAPSTSASAYGWSARAA